MSEPDSLAHRCDQCAHVDMLRGVHPMMCRNSRLSRSLACGAVRAEDYLCGTAAAWWEPAAKYRDEQRGEGGDADD